MTAILNMIKQLMNFAACFGLIKCAKGMIAGTIMLIPVLLIHMINRRRNTLVNVCSYFLLFPMVWMGYSRLYFYGKIFRLSNWMCRYLNPRCGYLYFFIAAILLIRFLVKNHRQYLMVRRLPESEVDSDRITGSLSDHRFAAYYLSKVKIYETPEAVSPYSGGLLHPYIVLPSVMVRTWTRKDLDTILFHEMTHIRYGHILILSLFSVLRIYWWINPFFYLAEEKLREDLELFCDEQCLCRRFSDSGDYGNLLLQTAHLTQALPQKNIAAFFPNKNFRVLRTRIRRLTGINQRKMPNIRLVFVLSALAVLLTTGVIYATSYPRYTTDSAVSLHDKTGKLLLYDTPSLHDALVDQDGTFSVDIDCIRDVLDDHQIQESQVCLFFGTIQKTPGIGGCGNMIWVDLEDPDGVCLLSASDWRNRFETFFIKYMI